MLCFHVHSQVTLSVNILCSHPGVALGMSDDLSRNSRAMDAKLQRRAVARSRIVLSSNTVVTPSRILASGVTLLAGRATTRGREARRTRWRRSTREALGTWRRHAREGRKRETAWWGEGQGSGWWHGHAAGTGREWWETTATGS